MSITDKAQLAAMPWLFGKMERKAVTELFQRRGSHEGSFLVRESTKSEGDFVLSLFLDGRVEHFIISNEGGILGIDDGPKFTNLQDLVNFYRSTADRLPRRLGRSICRSSDDDGTEEATPAAPKASRPAPPIPQEEVAPPAPPAPQPPPMPAQATPSEPKAASPTKSAKPPLAPKPQVEPMSLAAMLTQSGAAGMKPSAINGGGWLKIKDSVFTNQRNREQLYQVPRIKKWIDAAAAVAGISLNVTEEKRRNLPEGFTEEALGNAVRHEEIFSQAALEEERLYISWLNHHLKALGKPEVSDLGPSLKTGATMVEVVGAVSGQKPPAYRQKPAVVQQEIDNWHVVVQFMTKVGMCEKDESEDDGGNLDPALLHSSDRREILKLFSKLLLYEAQHS
eukprot:m.75728 g.75728  ORF g.75728 m.75728 type:complete len:394 (-) comp14604_c0_seq1:148-1329(-)